MNQPDIAFFDLDNTVIDTDCELTWKHMLADLGRVPNEQRAKQQHYINLHAIGKTPEEEYLEFFLREFVGREPCEMKDLARYNFDNYLQDKLYPQALEEIEALKAQGLPTVLLSGSTRIVVTPIAEALGVCDVVCTELELEGGKYTGGIVGPFCIRDGKLKRLLDYCRRHGKDPRHAMFYGDSVSDIPVFEKVGRAVVVNPNPKLKELAQERNWNMVCWKLSRAEP